MAYFIVLLVRLQKASYLGRVPRTYFERVTRDSHPTPESDNMSAFSKWCLFSISDREQQAWKKTGGQEENVKCQTKRGKSESVK
ncbi:hypothetical protein RUM43_008890 [Polyplax serrata]|uniref:Uncharacterized protein n=1 Tax=Polyplax serrata TaxID=468196 RepID=A0AAN8P9Z0_POLSC